MTDKRFSKHLADTMGGTYRPLAETPGATARWAIGSRATCRRGTAAGVKTTACIETKRLRVAHSRTLGPASNGLPSGGASGA